ncbi:hypothetical protein ACIHCQ_18910 [Streptomyces sp. NPDC052236]|uniref:hypothetical protein n=1 Tax=Streptomyces sp. NPDC052236 TaxID=3365686 RepID=UPI0037CDC83A
MTGDDNTESQATSAVRLRTEGEVDEETLAYARKKIDAITARPGPLALTGEVRIAKAAAHHSARPWTATADLRVGGHTVVVVAEEATGREVVDQLQDRLRRQTDKAAHARAEGRRAAAPPWRGGDTADGHVA